MTPNISTAATWAAEATSPAWPATGTMVLRSRPLRAGTGPDSLPRFSDDIWRLQAAHPDLHAVAATVCWDRFPPPLVEAFKAFALAALDHPYPDDPNGSWPGGERPAVTTIALWVRDLRVLAWWLHERGVTQLCDMTADDLDAYRRHVVALACSADRRGRLLASLRPLWAYRAHLPPAARLAPDPGDARDAGLGGRPWSEDNKTPRIAPATMEALLAWSLTMVEQVAADIVAANRDFCRLAAGTHPSQAALAGLGPTVRARAFVDRARRDGTALPGHPGQGEPAVNWSHLARVMGLYPSAFQRPDLRRIITDAGLGVADDSYLGPVNVLVSGSPWRERPVTVGELPTMLRLCSAAAFVVVAYLSGMRPGEVLNLRRGCASRDEDSGELLVFGQPGKGYDRLPTTDEEPCPQRPWVVVTPVHHAITVLEQLADGELLFPASLARHGSRRSACGQARSPHQLAVDIEDFVAWVNSNFPRSDGTPAIPPDPAGHIHASRFRRALAYFVVRRPRGLIAAALQYGHVSTKVTLGYSGRADTTWQDDLVVERLEMVLEQAGTDARLLDEGEHVSGPSAIAYKDRVRRAVRFAGRSVTQARNVERLLASTDPAIYHGDGMTCVWRPDTALCRKARVDQGLGPNGAPEQSECRSSCANLAYTDRDVSQLRDRCRALTAASADQLAPQPLRDRAAAIVEQLQAVIDRHEMTRQPVLLSQPGRARDRESDGPPTS